MNIPVFTAVDPAAVASPPPVAMPERPARTWQRRRSEEVLVQVWRTVANAGPKGIGPSDIRTKLNNIDVDVLKQHLHELRRKGHIRYTSPTASLRYGCWAATATPWPTEDPPAWQRAEAEEADDRAPDNTAQVFRDKAQSTVEQALANAPRSVFGMVVLGEVDIDAVHRRQETAESADATDAIGASQAAQPVDGAAAADPAAADAPPPAPPAPPAADKPADAAPTPIVVALDNQGRLLVHEDGNTPVVLSRHATGALFRYLDRTVLNAPRGGILSATLP